MTRIVLMFAVVATVLSVACGGGSDGNSDDSLESRVKAHFEAVRDDPPRDSYAFYLEECREKYSVGDYSSTIVAAKALFEGFLNIKFDDLRVEEVKITDRTDTTATVRMTILTKDGDNPFEGDDSDEAHWKFEDGEWYNADCSDLSFDSDFEPEATSTVDNGSSTGGPTPTSAAGRATPAAQPTSASKPKVGDTVSASGGKYRLNGLEDNLEGSEFSKPPAGKRWVAFDITIEAVSAISYSPFDYTVQDSDSFVYEPEFIFVDEPGPELSSGDLGPGGTVRGWVFFEIPAKATLTTLRVEVDFGKPVVVIADFRQ